MGDWLKVSLCILQRVALALLLFVLLTNDLVSALKSSSILLADCVKLGESRVRKGLGTDIKGCLRLG